MVLVQNSFKFLKPLPLKLCKIIINDITSKIEVVNEVLRIIFDVPGIKTEDIECSYEGEILFIKTKCGKTSVKIGKNWALEKAAAEHLYGQYIISIPKTLQKKNIIPLKNK